MTWGDFQKEAYTLTEADIKRLSRTILSEYSRAYREIDALVQSAYLRTLSTVGSDAYYNEIIKFDRLKNLQAQIKAEYFRRSNTAGRQVSRASQVGFSNMYYRKMYAAEWLAPEITVGLLPADLAELAVFGTEESWKGIKKGTEKVFGAKKFYQSPAGTLVDLLRKNRDSEIKRIQSAITNGFINGDSYTKMTNNIKGIIGKQLERDGVFSVTGAKSNAMRIVRTEGNRTMNAGAYAATKDAESQGIEIQKQYLAVLDDRTRSQSASMDGQRRKPDEPFTYPNGAESQYPGNSGVAQYDINDRCGMIDIIDDKGPQIRRGRNPETGKNEVFTYDDFNEWAESKDLTRNKYGQIVGKEKVS